MNLQPENSSTKLPNSRLGIASLIIGIATPILLILLILLSILLGSKKGSIGNFIAIFGVIFGLSAPFLHLTGLILGLSGWISKKTRNFFPIVGTILNAFLGISGILLIYIMISNLRYGFR